MNTNYFGLKRAVLLETTVYNPNLTLSQNFVCFTLN